MKTRISVIIPIYNIQEFLEECLDSVVNQTINNLELTDGYERNLQVLLIDDGSTDDSAKIAKEYSNKYDNFEYIYEENQGLGHARNYGCEFAEGDYIIFLDSDDIVPPKAYERMYKSAVKNNVDMTIGNVTRFTSKKVRRIKIHKTAFSGFKEVTHMIESPELFYDTTAWNKLIKRSFWEKYNFKFPEGILYEDIPVTMPMHYLANKVSIVYETCYLWRIREGISKSITQTTDTTKNLTDRLTVMGMVDDFFKENVSEKHLFETKLIKWLDIDLMMYVDSLSKLSEEEYREYRNLLVDYIKENIDSEKINHLNEINRLKYEYLLNDEFEKLVDLINFEKNDLKFTNVYSKDNHLMIDVDEKIFKTSPFCIDNYIREGYERKIIQKVSLKKNNLSVKSFFIMPGLKDDDFNDRQYSIELYNSESHERIPLEFENVKTGDLSKFNIRYGDNLSYESAGFVVQVPYDEIINNPNFIGENRILVNFKQDTLEFNYFLAHLKKNVRTTSYLKARIYEDHYIFIDYDEYNELILNVKPIKYCYEKVTIEDNKLCIHSPNFNGDLFICYENDLINDERKIPLSYDDENRYYSLPLANISSSLGQIRYEDNEPIVYKEKEHLYFTSKYGQITINALRDYHFDIKKYDNLSIISNISNNEEIINIDAEVHTIDLSNLKSAALYVFDEVTFDDILLANGKVLSNDKVNFNFDFSNENVLKNLSSGVHDLYIKYDFDGKIIKTQVFLSRLFSHTYSEGLYSYKLYRSGKSILRIKTDKKWPENLNTKIKRNQLINTKYEKFKRLPIHPKRIMFESYWGKQFNCNPRYFYEFIKENYPDYECVWSFNDEHKQITGDGIRVRKNSVEYFYYLATSKYFMDNVNFDEAFTKREGQIYVQTMHGTPLKSLGLDVPTDFKTKKDESDFIERCSRWDYLLVQSDYVSGLSKRCFEFEGELLEVGYPRTDILYSRDNEKDIIELKQKLGLPLDKKVILYAPTWRLKNKFELMIDLKSFKENLSDEYVLLLRMHHFARKSISELENSDFIYDFSKYGSMEELYLVSDILITDYSSAMFDYAILNRPIILFTYDMEEYINSIRGTYFDLEEYKPGPIVSTYKELEDTIVNIDKIHEEYKPYMHKFQEKFHQYECENSSEKIFNEVIKNNDENSISGLFNRFLLKVSELFIK